MALPKTTWSDVGRRCVEHRAPTPDGETYVYASCLADDMPSYAAVTIVPPGTLTELLEDSTAVVLGRPTHYRDNEDEYAKPTDPGLEDSTGVMELRVAEVLTGHVADDSEILLPAGVGGPEPKAENLRRLNADLPEGDSVWFVQTMQTNDPRVHRMSHPYAVFCQGADSVASDRPSSEGDLGFVTELERHRTMGELVSYPRTLTVP